jgi:uncharacterized protein YecE (DUF72 family)
VKVRVGTSGYAYKEWKGSFYPAELKPDAMLGFYASRFDTVEVNNTFYRMPQAKVVAGWADATPEQFSFVLKAPQRITHIARLKNVGDTVAHFLRVASELGPKQGPLLFQLPPNFKKDAGRLADLLAALPRTVRAAIEFRHASWFDDETYAALQKHGVALCTVETEEGKTPLVATAPFGYFRLREMEYSDAELASWAESIHAQPWQDAWVFFKHEDEGRGPKLAARMNEALYAASV